MADILSIRINLMVDDASIEELIMNKQALRLLNQGYQEEGIETPERILDKISEIEKAISFRVEDDRRKELRKLKLRYEAEAPKEERRTAMKTQIEALEAKLGKKTTP